MLYLLILVLAVLGFMGLFKPELMWKLEHFMSVKDGEPTEFYLVVSRIIGALALITVIIIIFVLIF